nr:ribosomal protein [Tanacetum cinerariifolium]
MSDSSNYSNMSDLDDIADIDMVMQLINEDQQMQGESSRRSRKAINRERDMVEARLMADYFGPSPKYPDYYFRPGANNDLTVLNHSSLFDDLLDDIAPVVPYDVNGVMFEKGYYLADGIYPQWAAFVISFTVSRYERNAVFKRRQESVPKDIEIAFGVLQGRWHIIAQPARAWTVNKLRRIVYTEFGGKRITSSPDVLIYSEELQTNPKTFPSLSHNNYPGISKILSLFKKTSTSRSKELNF